MAWRLEILREDYPTAEAEGVNLVPDYGVIANDHNRVDILGAVVARFNKPIGALEVDGFSSISWHDGQLSLSGLAGRLDPAYDLEGAEGYDRPVFVRGEYIEGEFVEAHDEDYPIHTWIITSERNSGEPTPATVFEHLQSDASQDEAQVRTYRLATEAGA